MDFLDPKKKRAHTIRLFIGYALVAVALIIGTGIVALEVFGFDFNRKTGAVIQNGLVFIDAHPDVADIYINGTNNGKTANRLVMPEGQYSIELKRSGYRTWKNQFELDGGTIKQFVYPFLFPEKLAVKPVKQYASSPDLVSESPDRHWLFVQQPGSLTSFDLIDLTTNTNSPVLFNLPANLLSSSSGAQSLNLVEWSNDNRHLIVRHDYNATSEYVEIDRETPEASQNLTKLYSKSGVQFSLRDKKFDQLYIYDPVSQLLSTSDLKNKVITPLINKVTNFTPFGSDMIVYTTTDGATADNQLVKVKSGDISFNLRMLPNSSLYLLDLAKFNNKIYIAVGGSTDGKIYIYKDPANQIKNLVDKLPAPISLLKLDNPKYMSFSTNSRFLSVQSGSQFALYDAEDDRPIHFDNKLASLPTTKANWMDGHRLTVNKDNKIIVFDFDGNNLQSLSPIDDVHAPIFDRDYKAMFSIGPVLSGSTNTSLLRTELKVNSSTTQ